MFLLTHALEGYGRAIMEPLLPVSISVHTHESCNYIPYSEKLLREKTFMNFEV